ncbi:MAG TPA: YbaB/EbfC family nucleoid-associated protein [Rhodospirillaceae bacterium]|nr:YbaB/EbfC family nucleoid-associated protein [Rhodospirillaceae bacterium]MAX63464.1 YbaB/EbfC family nucleoid-associated protein [Rhodospirillaceae bacterium]MBB56466.1 YbaB/EbfC family nucleoid-associated protein [Rhodospirillaceae bacterium]HAD99885.1 YbaB/EbfC family nucleoid-associated protein [Rhodospirillaceae bacterium]HAJ22819.1 YbaB/EbfC family nucleoid-associated protein [Rhodospirillaceae bacterium]
MKNLGSMMKQAQEMQSRMQEMQAQMENLEMQGSAGGGLVSVTITGKGELRRLNIDPSLVDPTEKEVMEDLIVAAVNDAKAKADERMRDETQKLMGGLQLPPGMKLPF